MKEQASKLSDALTPRIDAQGSPQRLILDKIISDLLPELRNRKMQELFQPAIDPVDSGPSGAVVGPSIDQAYANNQLPYPHGTAKPGQSIHVDDSPRSPQWQPPRADIENGNPSNSTTNGSEYTTPSTYHGKSNYLQEPDQQPDRNQESHSSFQGDRRSAQPESGHTWGSPESQDNYYQDDDWRAEPQPDDCEEEDPDSQYGGLRRSSLSEEEFSDWDSYLILPP